ncbi:metallophosphoesterase [Dokdonella sp.]|uniref:metallophosphoesterase n=1 Tax=Dokdonella sp. TaxID=2291710 RepID=UPI003529391D
MPERAHPGHSSEPAVTTATTIRVRVLLATLVMLLPAGPAAFAAARQVDAYHWTGVERIVAIGDLHGDYQSYLLTLRTAGLIDERDQWSGGKTHLVQLGDIPDRGADTLQIIAHMKKLAAQAKRKGGHVHNLMGNHEAMNTYGDLRYVSAGEFAAFAGRDSAQLRDRYYENVLADIKARDPAAFANLPENHREEWNRSHPLGWVEHQQAWNPKWNPKGEYFEWVMDTEVAIQINDLVFLHGGLSSGYCRNSLSSLTDKARAALRESDPATPDILTDELGPLWYRGLSGVEPVASDETVEAILAQHGARHIVVGHTPTEGAIWPRYSARVIQVDTGLSEYYGGHVGYLEVSGDTLYAGYPNGRVALPGSDAERPDYLRKVMSLQPGNTGLQKQLDALQVAASATSAEDSGQDSASTPASESAATVSDQPICGISP